MMGDSFRLASAYETKMSRWMVAEGKAIKP